jgi:hypothetical protein
MGPLSFVHGRVVWPEHTAVQRAHIDFPTRTCTHRNPFLRHAVEPKSRLHGLCLRRPLYCVCKLVCTAFITTDVKSTVFLAKICSSKPTYVQVPVRSTGSMYVVLDPELPTRRMHAACPVMTEYDQDVKLFHAGFFGPATPRPVELHRGEFTQRAEVTQDPRHRYRAGWSNPMLQPLPARLSIRSLETPQFTAISGGSWLRQMAAKGIAGTIVRKRGRKKRAYAGPIHSDPLQKRMQMRLKRRPDSCIPCFLFLPQLFCPANTTLVGAHTKQNLAAHVSSVKKKARCTKK